MTFTVSPWVAWAGICLALFGAWFVLAAVRDGLRQLWGWLVRDRVAPLLEDDDELQAQADEEMGYFDGPPPLPPERTWEQMTSHQLPVTDPPKPYPFTAKERQFAEAWGWHQPERERQPPAYETEARAHYVAMGFDYPSGLMARVRELTP